MPGGFSHATEMKRIVIVSLFLMVLAAIFIVIVLTLVQRAPRPVGLAFVGFTNNSERNEAVFWFTNSAATNFSWFVEKMSRRDLTGWVEEPRWTNAGPSRYTPKSASGVALAGYEDLDLVGLPVWTTNAPVRVVIGYFGQEQAERGPVNWIRKIGDSFVAGAKVTNSNLRQLQVTGETIIK
jgi:hypothetical protein